MGKLDKFRKILALPEVMDNVELTAKLKDLYTDYLELLEKNNELQAKLREMEEISNIKKIAKVNSGFYTIEGIKDIYGDEIPFCLNCLYEYGLQIPMVYGIVERGIKDLASGRTIRPSVYGLSCNKCKAQLAASKKGDK